jgi:hypothetical protein
LQARLLRVVGIATYDHPHLLSIFGLKRDDFSPSRFRLASAIRCMALGDCSLIPPEATAI